jgi:hypothetical protein
MTKLTKRAKAIAEKVEPGKLYSIDDAALLLNDLSTVKFKESIDVAINLGIDARKSDQAVRGATTLPMVLVKMFALRSLPVAQMLKPLPRLVLMLSAWMSWLKKLKKAIWILTWSLPRQMRCVWLVS